MERTSAPAAHPAVRRPGSVAQASASPFAAFYEKHRRHCHLSQGEGTEETFYITPVAAAQGSREVGS